MVWDKRIREKYMWDMEPLPIETRIDLAQKGLWSIIARMTGTMHNKYGQEADDAIYNSLRNWDIHQREVARFGSNGKKIGLIEFVVKVMDRQDNTYLNPGPLQGIREVTELSDSNKLRIVMPKCNVAKYINREYPETCRVVVAGLGAGWTDAANPDLQWTTLKVLSDGDDCCEFFLEDTSRSQRETSGTNTEYKWSLKPFPAEVRLDFAQKGLWSIISRIVKTMDEKYGQDALDAISDALRNWDVHEKEVTRSGKPFGKMSLRDFVLKVSDAQDNLYLNPGKLEGIRKITEDPDENRLGVIMPQCNVAQYIARESTKTCKVVVSALGEGWLIYSNPNFKCTNTKLLSAGDDYCEFFFENTNKYG